MGHKKRSLASRSIAPPSEDSSTRIVQDCNRALNALNAGNYARALKLVNDCLSRYPDSPVIHSTRGTIHHKTALRTHDSTARLKLLQKARDYDLGALLLSPNSISFALFYAQLLFDLAENEAGVSYEAVIQECERALLIEHPTDPAEDLVDVEIEEDSSPQSRIEKMRKELIKLIEKSKKRIILGDVDMNDKFKRLVEDNSLTEIKNEIGNLERRKKEIMESFQVLKELPPSDDRFGEKRKYKNLKKLLSNIPTTSRVRYYWNNSMNVQSKRELLKRGIEELKGHFHKNKLAKANDVLVEAIDSAKEAKKWKVWVCCCCGKRFQDNESNVEHIKNVHLGTLSDNLRSCVPEVVSEATVNMVEFDVWKPVDSISATKILENLPTADEGLEVPKIEKWPYCDDGRRAEIIERIREKLRLFMRIKCFASSHVAMLLRLTMAMLTNRISKSVLKDNRMHQRLLSICFLEVSELESVLECLENMATTCALSCLCESLSNDEVGGDQGLCRDVRERIVFSSDFSRLLFDERLLRGEINVPDDGTAVTSTTAEDCDNDEPVDSDHFVFWLWIEEPTIGEHLKTWTSLRENSKSRGMEFFKILEKEFHRLQGMCERKCKFLRYQKSLKNVKSICLEEKDKSEQIPGYDPQSYASLLLKRKKELEMEGDAATGSSSFELNIICSILQEAQSDTDIEIAIQKHKDQVAREIFKLDAIMLATNAAMGQTGQKLGMVSVCDYRVIMVPLLKSFMQAHLKDLVDKDAADKSNAATEALLAELAHDAKDTNKGVANVRQGQGKSKDKKKKKDHRKAIDGSEEQHPLHPENAELVCFPAERGGNYPNPEIGVRVSIGDLMKQLEEELRRDSDEMQRKLDETLELQRQIENEAKQKRLAEQITNVAEGLPIVSSEPGEDVGSSEQQQQQRQSGTEGLPFGGLCFGNLNWTDFVRGHNIKSDDKSSEVEPVSLPSSDVCFGRFNWTDFSQAHSDESDIQSSELEQPQPSEAPEAD